MNRRHCLGGLIGLAGGVLAAPVVAQAVRKPWPRKNSTPAVQLPSADGGTWRLIDERGHPLLLNFWASWCEPCRAEMPSLERLAIAHRDAGLRVVAINYREGEPAVQRFLSNTQLTLPVVRDPEGAAALAFGINIFPSTVAIDRQGRTHFIVVGELDWNGTAAVELIRPLL